ncbi:DNA polymerase III subunit delta [Wenxinia saemankumensis]|uniref:DNA-directed DNA polymerase n=1 Tax=Wenxinia saemankumensis TaxID=1447782 RepID=A0A1M6FX10_9RHOB|nr:DNA polymerase III subunit delta [Wenxinia saemankumensis]SHJ02265.1 DNA polymerase III, delta subunit [Wenxinia saemankumensis]
MKIAPRDAAAFVRKPPETLPGILIYGDDAGRVALRRQDLLQALVGPEAEQEMRLTRLNGSDLRSDSAALDGAMRAQGFFPGPRAVHVEGATDGLADLFRAALEDWRAGDATIVATAGSLTARSALRKLFEGDRRAACMALYDQPPSEAETLDLCARAGLRPPEGEARGALMALSRDLSPGDFRQTIEKLGLYLHGEDRAVTVEDIAAIAPRSMEAALDDAIAVVADGRQDELADVLRRLDSQGVTPVSLLISTTRHFRQLHAAASDPGGPVNGLSRARPPVFGPRRDAMAAQAGRWGRAGLEKALATLIDTDLAIRAAARTAPDRALVERALIRLTLMARGRG